MSAKVTFLYFTFLYPSILILIPSCGTSGLSPESAAIVKTPVTITSVMIKPITESVDLPAVSQYMSRNITRATTSGIIEQMMIRQGDHVSAGQLLFTVRTRESAALQKAHENDNPLSFNGLIEIRANGSGVINTITYQKGDYVQEGDAVAVISEQQSLVFILEVPFEYQSFIGNGIVCQVLLPDSTEIRGTITGKLPEMNVESQTVSYIIRPGVPLHLPAGLIANVSIIKSSKDKAQVLQRDAVLSNETQSRFWVMKLINDSTAVRINISKGFENKDLTEVIEPHFSESDRIILEGNYGLADTAFITISGKE